MTTISHFICPQVIRIDNIKLQILSEIEFDSIPVHAVYLADCLIEIKCVNKFPLSTNPKYEIQDLSGNVLSKVQLLELFEDLMPHLRHADVSGGSINELSIIGAPLTLINKDLSQLLYEDDLLDISGNIKIRDEIYKTLSSYLTNHQTLCLQKVFVDLSGGITEQMNTPFHISDKLKGLETLSNTDDDKDTKSYLNAFLRNSTNNEVFGSKSVQSLIFIVASQVSLMPNLQGCHCLSRSSLAAIGGIDQKFLFGNDPGDPLYPEGDVNHGIWYAAVCFKIKNEIEEIDDPGEIDMGTGSGSC